MVANKKLDEGKTEDAIRCFEEILKLQDNQEAREKLATLYQRINYSTTDTTATKTLWELTSIPLLFTGLATTGLLIGLFDLLLASLLSPLYGGGEISIIVAILSWIPTVTMIFLNVLFVRAMLRWTLYKNKQMSMVFILVLTALSTFFSFYSILEGQALLRNLQAYGLLFSVSAQDGIFAICSVLTHGGLDALINKLLQGKLPDYIFITILIIGVCICLFTCFETAFQTMRWQSRLFQIRDKLAMNADRSGVVAWIILGFLVLGIGFINVLVYPGSFVNIENTYQHIALGRSELDQHHIFEAIDHFKNVERQWPDSVTSHLYLGLGYLSQDDKNLAHEELNKSLTIDPNSFIAHFFNGSLFSTEAEYKKAIDEYKFVSNARYEWGVPHATLAILYYIVDENDLSKSGTPTGTDL